MSVNFRKESKWPIDVIVSNVGGLTDVAKEDGKEDEAVGGSDQNDAQIHSGNDEEHDWKCFKEPQNRKQQGPLAFDPLWVMRRKSQMETILFV